MFLPKYSCFNTNINVILNSALNWLLLVYRNAIGSLGDSSDGKELAAHTIRTWVSLLSSYIKSQAWLCAPVIPVLGGQTREDLGRSLTSYSSPFSGLQVQHETLFQNSLARNRRRHPPWNSSFHGYTHILVHPLKSATPTDLHTHEQTWVGRVFHLDPWELCPTSCSPNNHTEA